MSQWYHRARAQPKSPECWSYLGRNLSFGPSAFALSTWIPPACFVLAHSLAHPPTHSLTHSLAHLLTHLYSRTHTFNSLSGISFDALTLLFYLIAHSIGCSEAAGPFAIVEYGPPGCLFVLSDDKHSTLLFSSRALLVIGLG